MHVNKGNDATVKNQETAPSLVDAKVIAYKKIIKNIQS